MVFVVHPDGPRELTVLSVEYVQLKLRTTVKNYSGAPGRVTYRTEVIEFPLGTRNFPSQRKTRATQSVYGRGLRWSGSTLKRQEGETNRRPLIAPLIAAHRSLAIRDFTT
jgi:hypothetical protein